MCEFVQTTVFWSSAFLIGKQYQYLCFKTVPKQQQSHDIQNTVYLFSVPCKPPIPNDKPKSTFVNFWLIQIEITTKLYTQFYLLKT